jgi:hypothetical protein
MATTFERERHNVGRGWQPLIEQVHTDLTELLGEYDLWQIKEHFGGLRYYMAPVAGCNPSKVDQIRNIITKAEDKSFETCEVCGVIGEPRALAGWIKTLCDEHHWRRQQAVQQAATYSL